MNETHYAASERIPYDEDNPDTRLTAALATSFAAHREAGSPKACRFVREVLRDEDGIIIRTECVPA